MMLGWEEYINCSRCLCPLCQREWEEGVRREVREAFGQLAAMQHLHRELSPKEVRRAYIEAIMATLCALELERARTRKLSDPPPPEEVDEHAARRWLERLIRDLEDLDRGVVAVALRCEVGADGSTQVSGLPTNEWMKRVSGVSLTEGLRLTGRFKTYEEAAQVVTELRSGVTREEIIYWCREFKKGRVKHREAAKLYAFQMRTLNEIKAAGKIDEFVDSAVEDIRRGGEQYRPPPTGRGK
jgi:hypothetical protein